MLEEKEFEKIKAKYKDHVLVEILNTEKTKIFEFKNENSYTHYQRWIIDKGTLIILGDNYDSIYRWNDSSLSLKFLANCDLYYFSSKCVADKDGSNQKTYDSVKAEEALKKIAIDRIYDNEIDEIENWETLSFKNQFEIVQPYILKNLDIEEYELEKVFYTENVYDAVEILMKKENEFMFGIDGWEYSNDLETLTFTPKFHLAALKVAYEKYPNAF